MSFPAVILGSEDPSWLRAAGEAVVRSGGMVVAAGPDVVSLLAYAALDLADVVLVDPETLTLDRAALIRLRRRGLRVISVSGHAPGVGRSGTFEGALAEASKPEGITGQPVVAIFGSKGAPGATRLAIATAQALAGDDRPTALLDLDPRGGDVAGYLEIAEEISVLVAMEALTAGVSWSFTRQRGALAVLAAPTRPTWCQDVVAADVGLLLDAVRGERSVVVDAGVVGASVDEFSEEILRRATHVVLVGRTDRIARPHLRHAASLLAPIPDAGETRAVHVMTDLTDVPSMVQAAADVAALLGAEEQHQPGRGVEQHRDRHRNPRRRSRLLGHVGRRHQGDGPIVGGHGSEHMADHDHDHLQ